MLIPVNPLLHPPAHLGPNLLWFHASFVLKICGKKKSTKTLNAAKSAKHKGVLLITVYSLCAILLSLIKYYQKAGFLYHPKQRGGFKS